MNWITKNFALLSIKKLNSSNYNIPILYCENKSQVEL